MTDVVENASMTFSNNPWSGTVAWAGNTIPLVDSSNAYSEALGKRGFGFNIPDGATIDNILDEAELALSAGYGAFAYGNNVQLCNGTGNGDLLGSIQSCFETVGVGDCLPTWYTLHNGLYNASVTPALLNNANCGVVFSLALQNMSGMGDDELTCSGVRRTVTYTAGGVTQTVSAVILF